MCCRRHRCMTTATASPTAAAPSASAAWCPSRSAATTRTAGPPPTSTPTQSHASSWSPPCSRVEEFLPYEPGAPGTTSSHGAERWMIQTLRACPPASLSFLSRASLCVGRGAVVVARRLCGSAAVLVARADGRCFRWRWLGAGELGGGARGAAGGPAAGCAVSCEGMHASVSDPARARVLCRRQWTIGCASHSALGIPPRECCDRTIGLGLVA